MYLERTEFRMSDAGDSVEELESRIAELEATVRGLTEELVDANERVRLLERRVEGAEPSATAVDGEREATDEDAVEREIAAPSGTEDEAPKPTETDESTDEEPESSDDIIVA